MADKGKHEAKTEKKRSGGILKVLAYAIILAAVLFAGWYLLLHEPETWSDAFAASSSNDTAVYVIDKDGMPAEAGRIIRGTPVKSSTDQRRR